MSRLTADHFATYVLPTREVSVDGGTVKVRSLSRAEVLAIDGSMAPADLEAHLLAVAVVEPALTIEEAREWQTHTASNVLKPITDAISELSGFSDDVESTKRRFRDGE